MLLLDGVGLRLLQPANLLYLPRMDHSAAAKPNSAATRSTRSYQLVHCVTTVRWGSNDGQLSSLSTSLTLSHSLVSIHSTSRQVDVHGFRYNSAPRPCACCGDACSRVSGAVVPASVCVPTCISDPVTRMEAATIWKWVRRIFRYYVYFILVVWLTSALMLLYLMHAPASAASASLAHPASSSAGPYRLHELMIASTATLHTNLHALLNNTRATSSALLLPPSPLHRLTSPVAEAVEAVVGVLESGVDSVCELLRELADEWLVQTVEMMEELRERQQQQHAHTASTRSLPWQQQQLDVTGDAKKAAAAAQQQQQQQQQHKQHHRHPAAAEGGKTAGGDSTTAASGHRPASPSRASRGSDSPSRAPLSITEPITMLHRSVLPDGSVLFVSPLPSDDAAFSLESVAEMGDGVDGEQRVALSLKDGLVRVTRKGHRDDGDELVRQLRGDHSAAAASAA